MQQTDSHQKSLLGFYCFFASLFLVSFFFQTILNWNCTKLYRRYPKCSLSSAVKVSVTITNWTEDEASLDLCSISCSQLMIHTKTGARIYASCSCISFARQYLLFTEMHYWKCNSRGINQKILIKAINTTLNTDPHLGSGCIFKSSAFLFNRKVMYTPIKK